jgi:hypothetical protein
MRSIERVDFFSRRASSRFVSHGSLTPYLASRLPGHGAEANAGLYLARRAVPVDAPHGSLGTGSRACEPQFDPSRWFLADEIRRAKIRLGEQEAAKGV